MWLVNFFFFLKVEYKQHFCSKHNVTFFFRKKNLFRICMKMFNVNIGNILFLTGKFLINFLTIYHNNSSLVLLVSSFLFFSFINIFHSIEVQAPFQFIVFQFFFFQIYPTTLPPLCTSMEMARGRG